MILITNQKALTNFKAKDRLKVARFTDDQMASKLMSMGVLPGSSLEILRIAPLRGGYCLKVNGQKIAIRYNEAASILVE